MRLRRLSDIRKSRVQSDRNWQQKAEWVEERLLDAADFEPEREPAYDFVAVAMHRPARCSTSHGRAALGRLAGAGGAVAAALFFALLLQNRPARPLAGASIKLANEAVVEKHADQARQTTLAKAEQEPGGRVRATPGGFDDGYDNSIQSASYREEAPRVVRPHRRPHAVRRAFWKTETVERDATGVIAPGWIQQGTPNGPGDAGVTFAPVALNVPMRLDEKHAPARTDADGPSITLTSYTAGQ